MAIRRNDRGAAPRSRLRGNDMDAFDNLPAPIVHAMWETVVDWCPLAIALNLKRARKSGSEEADAITDQLGILAEADAWEIQQFCYHWPSRFGRGTPHVQANATIMRYDERGRHSRRARR
jgi:hypothetical protein